MDFHRRIDNVLTMHSKVAEDPPRAQMIRSAIENREAVASKCGALAGWTPVESTGRSPKDTYIVRRKPSEEHVDWSAENNVPMEPDTFEMMKKDALAAIGAAGQIYMTNRVLGADPDYCLGIRTVSDRALTALFTDNMFRPVPPEAGGSVFRDLPFLVVALPYHKLDPEKYQGRLRIDPATGKTSTMAAAMDFDDRIGLIIGSAYLGTLKKLMFTVMNYLTPEHGILPLHCAANEGPKGGVNLLLGLSGTGKTTLSADPRRVLLGDDEHAWSDSGIANFEGGCYAKLINLRQEKEPEIFYAINHNAAPEDHGAIVENAMIYPDGTFDFGDTRLTPNSRGSYPLRFLWHFKPSAVGGHPDVILFLTADANGVLPPIAKLDVDQAMFWFMMGYTSKVEGTERGIVNPVSNFSRLFGAPFIPRRSSVYIKMLGEKVQRHRTRTYLVNTGWSGGPFGIGKRMDIDLTRLLVDAAEKGALEDVEFGLDPVFRLRIPKSCPGLSNAALLNPRDTWTDKAEYDARAGKLAAEFRNWFEKKCDKSGVPASVLSQCP